MSEDKLLGKYTLFTFDDAKEFLAKRCPNPCPCCGHTQWRVTSIVEGKTGLASAGLAGVRVTTGGLLTHGWPVVTVTCAKCAFIRLHGANEISHWVEEGKPDFVDDEDDDEQV